MVDTTQVLAELSNHSFKLSHDVQEHHPHLEDKLVVDLINGIEVVNDHIKVSESRKTGLNRFFDSVSGKGKQRQDLINKNLSAGLKTASVWLQKHESDFIEVNLALGTIGCKLLETRAGVMQLDSKFNDLELALKLLDETLTNKNNKLNEYVQTVDLREKASTQVDSEISKWEAGLLSSLPLELRIYTVLDNLRNGRFALFLVKSATENEKFELLELVKNKLRKLVADELNQKPESINYWFEKKELCSWGNERPYEEKESIIYLSSWANKRHQSTVYAVNSILSSQDEEMPPSYNINRWITRSVDEQLGALI